jgi:adenylate kinase
MSQPLPNASDFLPGPVLMLGAPGVGKGTQAQLLMAEFGIPQISTGDLLRQHRRDHTSLGLLAEGLMEKGQFVPDDLVNEMVSERLAEPDTEHGYILDGFPRTLNQAEWLDTKLVAYMLPVVAVCINVDQDVLLVLPAAAFPRTAPSTTSTPTRRRSKASATWTGPRSSSVPTTPKPSSTSA